MADSAIKREEATKILRGEGYVSHERFRPANPLGAPLNPPGGGGTFDGMEARVAALETHVEHMREDVAFIKGDVGILRANVAQIQTDTAVLKADVSHLPRTGFVITAALGIVAAITAVIVYADTIRQALGLT